MEDCNTERLKTAWTRVMRLIHLDNDVPAALALIESTVREQDDTPMLRMMLDTTQTVRDEELVKPVRKKLIDTIEARIGKLH